MSRRKSQKKTSLTPEQRLSLITALIFLDLDEGRGTPEQLMAYRELEWRKCASSVVYWIEKYGRIIDKDGKIIPFVLWPIQKKLLIDWEDGISVCAVKARQLGVTTLSAHFALWEILFKDAVRWHIFSSSEEKARDIVERIQATKDNLPAWMVERAQSKNIGEKTFVDRKAKSDSFSRISFGLSEMKIMTSTPKSIQGAAGKFILDEFTLHTEKRRKIHMLLPAIDGGGMGIIIANGDGEEEFWQLYMRAKDGKNRFKPYFFSWRDDPNRDEKWYARAEEEFILDPKNAELDVFVFRAMYPSNEQEAFYLGGNSRFSLGKINEIVQNIHARSDDRDDFFIRGLIEPYGNGYTIKKNHEGKWKVFEKPKPGEKYAIGVDSSGGGSAGDYGVIQVLRLLKQVPHGATVKTKQVATFRAKVEPSLLAYEAKKAGKYYNEARINVEANNHGVLVKDRMKYDYYNLYMRKKVDRLTSDDTDLIGYWMTGDSKKYLIDQLAENIHADWVELNDLDTAKELASFEITTTEGGTEKMGAKSGMNDDLVLGLAHALECAYDVQNAYIDMDVISFMPWEDIEDYDREVQYHF